MVLNVEERGGVKQFLILSDLKMKIRTIVQRKCNVHFVEILIPTVRLEVEIQKWRKTEKLNLIHTNLSDFYETYGY